MNKNLRTLREENKKTVAEVAKVLRITEQAFYRYEQGERTINIEQVLLLSALYDESAEEIIKAQLNSRKGL